MVHDVGLVTMRVFASKKIGIAQAKSFASIKLRCGVVESKGGSEGGWRNA